jgi:hypothetical protein
MQLRSIVLLTALAAGLLACGGSSSESPWPVEPQGAALGPAGEASEGAGADDTEVKNEREEPGEVTDDKGAGEKKEKDPPLMRP